MDARATVQTEFNRPGKTEKAWTREDLHAGLAEWTKWLKKESVLRFTPCKPKYKNAFIYVMEGKELLESSSSKGGLVKIKIFGLIVTGMTSTNRAPPEASA